MPKEKKRKHKVLFVGRMSLQKGPDYFVRLAHKVLQKREDVEFLMAGSGPELKNIIELSINLGIHDKIKFLGFVPDDELKKLYSRADVFVMPSVSEPFGITALEAASSGTPVIVSKNAGVSEFLKNCIKVDFWDVNLISDLLNSLLDHNAVREEMSKRALNECRSLTWELIADKTIEVYRSLI